MHRLRNFLIVPLVAFVLACTITLAPEFDESLVNGLNQANEKTLTLFSAVSPSTNRSSYAGLAAKYDAVIGQFGALQIKAASRDLSPLAQRLARQMAKSPGLREICGEDATSCLNAAPSGIQEIIITLEEMKSVHAGQGLPEDLVNAFKGDYVISIQQVLTVELALKRN